MSSTSKPRNALGRGLGALLEDKDKMQATPVPESGQEATPTNFYEVPVDQIETNPFQPRTDFDQTALQELAESIRVQGIIQPITVRRLGKKTYQLISGERRLQASKLAGLPSVPAYIRTADDQQMLEMALIENIQRENLNAIEVALSYQRLISEIGLRQEELGDRVGKERSTVTNYLRLLKLPDIVQAALRTKQIGMGHARALLGVENVDDQLDIFEQVLGSELSVRQVEELVRKSRTPAPAKVEPKAPSGDMERVTQALSSHFGTKVNLQGGEEKGEIRIPYTSTDELNRLLEVLDVRL